MIFAAVCEDESAMLKQMHRVIFETFAANQIVSIIFLDILMPDRDGFDIAKEIWSISDKTLLLFVTSQDELVNDRFDYHPFYFLRKGSASAFSQSLSDAVHSRRFLCKKESLAFAQGSEHHISK